MGNLIPKNILKNIPTLYETEDVKNPLVYVKLFMDTWTWYITEISKDNDICFGYVVSPFGSELGYFSLVELSELKGSLGIRVELDLHFNQKSLSKVK